MILRNEIDNLSEEEAKDLLERIVEQTYTLIEWPDSQEYMEEEWFNEEAILALGNEDITGSSAYFIPTNKIFK